MAQETLEEANETLVDYSLKALLAGEDVEVVMEACGYVDSEETPAWMLLGIPIGPGSAKERFASWLGTCVANRVCREGSWSGVA